MDDIITVLFFVVFILANFAGERIGKKNRPPQRTPEDTNFNFDIPTLANDPNFPDEETHLTIKDTVQTEEVREIDVEQAYRQRKLAAQSEVKTLPKVEQKNFAIDLTPASAMNAIVLGEILGKPKSMRRR